MSKDEMRAILSERLSKYRLWSYAQLAEREGDSLEHVDGIASDGTAYFMELEVFWDDKPGGNIRVIGNLSAEPQKPLLGFLPIYLSDVSDSFIMSPDGRFVGEDETPVV